MLQRGVEDNFRGRVFAAELALLTLTMAISNYATGELLDRVGLSARTVAIGIGALFVLPGVAWFVTKRWWDKDEIAVEKNIRKSPGDTRGPKQELTHGTPN